ncbi:MAG: TIM barrel protein [Phycisphaerales bacterium]|nr:TIM barrel protein [Phycisphaerales bacterium]
MLLTLSATCLRSLLLPGPRQKKAKMDLADLPRFTHEELGLRGLNLSTDLLVGADRSRLEFLRERADKAGCACLLLIEHNTQNFGAASEKAGAEAIARAHRVIEAAHVLGCNSIALGVQSDEKAESIQNVVTRLKKVVERAERLEINVLLAPAPGLTAAPERLTDLIKKVGGFRIGTFPDFQAAAASKDPIAYLRRLTPYAAVVSASTIKFAADPIFEAPPEPAPKAGTSKSRSDVLSDILAETRKAGPGDAAPPMPPTPGAPAAAPADELEDELGEDDESLEGLEEALLGLEDEDEPPPPKPIPNHETYDLFSLVQAVASVGYDNTLAIDFRGAEDVTLGIIQSRDALQAAIDRAERAD